MTMRLAVVTLLVDDQDQALRFMSIGSASSCPRTIGWATSDGSW
jgi:hypothetical protein